MKVYIVTSGCYSDYHIDAVCLNKEDAEVIAENISGNFNDCPEVNEWDTDDFKIINDGLKLFYITVLLEKDRLTLKGLQITAADSFQSLITSGTGILSDYSDAMIPNLSCILRAKDEEHAKKIAYDMFAEWKAKKEGLV